jgi:hypothetical protein
VGAIITAEQSGAVRENTGEMVYYEHFATPGGLGYQEHINGTDIRYDGTTNPKHLKERYSTWMHMNLYWDTGCNNYAATWEQNVDSFGIAAYWGWNSFLGGVGMVNFPDTKDTFEAGRSIVFSTSECNCPDCMHWWYNTGYCESVGFTPNDLWVYVAVCDARGVDNYVNDE